MPAVLQLTCQTCGRVMEPRKRWRNNEVKYCSKACRRQRPNPHDRALEQAILELLNQRAKGATICPSEAARRVFDDWRKQMERARRAARRLVADNQVEITQKGRVVDPSTAKGPIRIRLR